MVHSADGSCITEEIEVFEPNREHTYRLIDGFTPLCMDGVKRTGAVVVRANPQRYTHHLELFFYYPRNVTELADGIHREGFFRGAMQRCFDAMAQDMVSGFTSGYTWVILFDQTAWEREFYETFG